MSLNDVDQSVGAGAPPTLNLLDLLDKCLMACVAVVMFGMMAVTFIDVLGRYVFSAPIPGGFEMIQFMMPLAMFGALPVITRSEEHIVISVMSGFLKSRGIWIQRFIVLIGCIIVNAGLTYIMWLQGDELAEAKQISGFLEWSFAPPAYLISILSAFTVVIILLMLILHVLWPTAQSTGGKRDAI
ncbi:MAG TPA: TRAP transporter small permease [Rhodospirillales bacterium]|nr:TRAP transporter small permease [Rhodospirillales bacterium]HJO86448.1 TRAP transporter small permease [Rhodospirillales bacterium]